MLNFLWRVFMLRRVSFVLVVFPSACDFTSNKSLIINYLCVTGTSFTSLSLVNSLTGYEPKLGKEIIKKRTPLLHLLSWLEEIGRRRSVAML